MIFIKQQPAETAHEECGVSLSIPLVPHRGNRDVQHQNFALQRQRIDEVANQEREVRHLKSFPTQHSDGKWCDCLLAADSGHRE